VHGPTELLSTLQDLQTLSGDISTWRTEFLKNGRACQDIPPNRSLWKLVIDQARYLYPYVEVTQPQPVAVILYNKPGCQGDVVRTLSKDDKEANHLELAGYQWKLNDNKYDNHQELEIPTEVQSGAPLANVLSMEPIFDDNKNVGAAYIGYDHVTDQEYKNFGDASRVYLRSEFVVIYKTNNDQGVDTYKRSSDSISAARHIYENYPVTDPRRCIQLDEHKSVVFLATLQYSKEYAMEEEDFDANDWEPQISGWKFFNNENCVGEPMEQLGLASSKTVEKLHARFWGFEDESGLEGVRSFMLVWENINQGVDGTEAIVFAQEHAR